MTDRGNADGCSELHIVRAVAKTCKTDSSLNALGQKCGKVHVYEIYNLSITFTFDTTKSKALVIS